MSIWNKNSLIRVYAFGKSYVLSSETYKEEKLQVCCTQDGSICLSPVSADEWNTLIQSKTNSVSSPCAAACVFNGYGCLGLLSTSIEQIQQEMHQTNQQSELGSETTTAGDTSSSSSSSASMQYFLIFVKEAESVGTIKQAEIMRITDVFILPLNTDLNTNTYSSQQNYSQIQSLRVYIDDIRKFLSSGVFYFSVSSDPAFEFDLTLSTQAKRLHFSTNKKFLWNYNLHIPFRRFNVDTSRWLLKIICGCVEIKKVIVYARAFKACIFSRLSCERVGARFHCRGVDDHGNCANFVETEQCVFATDSGEESSFLQLRGSVPLFFEQTGLQVGSHKLKILRSGHGCYPAFERHVQSLVQEYGPHVYALNLLGVKGDEDTLTRLYEQLCQNSHYATRQQLIYAGFDYHTQMKAAKSLGNTRLWFDLAERFFQGDMLNGTFFYAAAPAPASNGQQPDAAAAQHKLQARFVRTNCMDCLDRTNSVQTFLGIEMLKYQLRQMQVNP